MIASAEHALGLVAKIDQAVLGIIECVSKGSSSGLPDATHQFAHAAAELDDLLDMIRTGAPCSTTARLQQEVAAMEEELQEKDALIEQSRKKVQQWQTMCEEIKQQHESNLFNGITQQ
eukprot:CAMPEP_0202901740 /NCGR_PEP_ID=MMETSP1392-20130828/14429_1 /ASSEMBLY_ACC=CAM_ASM_000868 /TAXON_ID=225041 /ORGANISM="Chlamydomonas chlamydogama, Strain SAG 11-48b" /LENGTH=117 /DNA_ID=CAMNT_0049588349 /DNA_START=58 /DNA_END=411 /DNA_ORIENTATION=+